MGYSEAVGGMAFDEKGQAENYEDKGRICQSSFFFFKQKSAYEITR